MTLPDALVELGRCVAMREARRRDVLRLWPHLRGELERQELLGAYHRAAALVDELGAAVVQMDAGEHNLRGLLAPWVDAPPLEVG